MAVSEAIKNGRLVKSVVRDEFGSPKIADPDLADREWEANTDSAKRANAAGGVDREAAAPRRELGEDGVETVASSTQRLKSAQADLAELKLKEAQRELVPSRDVESRFVNVFTSCKTRLLAIPSRARQAMPHLSNADVAALDALVREALEELAA